MGGGVLEARAGKNINRNETKKERDREKQTERKRGQRGLKNRSSYGGRREKRR